MTRAEHGLPLIFQACEMNCRARAAWKVAVGDRGSDAQLSCGRHLGMTCAAMLGAEGRPGAVLAVTPLAVTIARLSLREGA